MNRDGSGARSVTDKLDRDIQSPRWAPDNSGVYFLYDDQGDTKIGFSTPDGSFKKIADHAVSGNSASGGGFFSLSRTGTVAFTYGRPDNPGDIAVSTSGAMRVLTAINQELLQQKAPGRVEEIWYESSLERQAQDSRLDHSAAQL